MSNYADLHEYEKPDKQELVRQGVKGNHVVIWEKLPKTEDVVKRKGKLGYSESKDRLFITTSVSCHIVNPKMIVRMKAPKVMVMRRRRK